MIKKLSAVVAASAVLFTAACGTAAAGQETSAVSPAPSASSSAPVQAQAPETTPSANTSKASDSTAGATTQDGLPASLSDGWQADDSARDVLDPFVSGFDSAFDGANTRAAVYRSGDGIVFAFVFDSSVDPRVFHTMASGGAGKRIDSRTTCSSTKAGEKISCFRKGTPSVGIAFSTEDKSARFDEKDAIRMAKEVQLALKP